MGHNSTTWYSEYRVTGIVAIYCSCNLLSQLPVEVLVPGNCSTEYSEYSGGSGTLTHVLVFSTQFYY
jgi:hypothetical protein